MSVLAKYAPRDGELQTVDGRVFSTRRPLSAFDYWGAEQEGIDVSARHGSEEEKLALDALIYARGERGGKLCAYRYPVYRDVSADDIKAALWEKGFSLGALARTHGVDRRELGRAIAPIDDDGLRKIVADAVGLQLHEIWPSLYRGDNSRKHRPAAPSDAERAAA